MKGAKLRGQNKREVMQEKKDNEDDATLKEKMTPWPLRRKKILRNVVVVTLLGIALVGVWTTGRPPAGFQLGRLDKSPVNSNNNNTQIQLGGVPPPARPLKVPYPIFLASHSKSGTTSMYHYFECGLGADYVAHRWTTTARKGGYPELIGRCMELNIDDGRPPFEGCGVNKYNQTQTVAWTDTAYIGGAKKCFHPNMDALDALVAAYPKFTVAYVVRNATEWYHSANSKRATFIPKWAKGCPQMPNTTDQTVWENFYHSHVQSIRDWAARYASQITYVEVPLDSPDTGRLLERGLGIDRTCWKHCLSSFTQEKCKDLQHQQQQDRRAAFQTRRLLEGNGTATLRFVDTLGMTTSMSPVTKNHRHDLASWSVSEVWDTILRS